MLVAQLTCVYPPYGGGIGEVARQYAAFLTAEHQVTVITPKYRPGMTFVSTPAVRLEPKQPLFWWGNAAWLMGLGRDLQKFDVVHLHYPFFGVHERLVGLPAKIKLIVTYHMMPKSEGLNGLLMKLSRRYSSQALAKRASVLTVATKDYLTAVALPDMDAADKWQVLPYAVDDRFKPGERSEILERKFNLRWGENVLLFVASLDKPHYFKGLSVLLEAVAKLKSENWKLIVVGGGNLRSHYQRQARELKLDQRVFFAGYVPPAQLPDYYRLANIFVLPSINWAESFGLAALEAMATGLPVIASRLPGVRELVQNGETGLLVPPQDAEALAAALENLLAIKAEQQRLGFNGWKKVQENYRWGVVGKKLLDIYRSL